MFSEATTGDTKSSDSIASNSSLVIAGVDTTEFLAVPEVYMTTFVVDEIAYPGLSLSMQPFEWKAIPGRISMRKGTAMMSLVSIYNNRLHYANQHTAMNRYIDYRHIAVKPGVDAELTIQWVPFSKFAEEALLQAVDHELIPELNVDEATENVIPWLKGLAYLGKAEIQGRVDGDHLVLSGYLNLSDEIDTYE